MIMSLDLPSELLFKIDDMVQELRRKHRPPVWPFLNDNVVRAKLSREDQQRLDDFRLREQEYKDRAGKAIPASRSFVIAEVIRWGLREGLLTEAPTDDQKVIL